MSAELRRVWRQGRRPGRRALPVIGALAVLAGVALRFYCPSVLWLDEAISVNIAKLPLSHLHAALRQDGAPPLYYVLLHFWMEAFGQGDVAVRALGGITSVVALPFFWAAGLRLGGVRLAWITFFAALMSPFAIFYATDARMYSLMILWCVLGFLAVARALEAPTRGRLVAVGLLTAVVLYTHYWGLYLVTVTGLWLLYQLWRHRRGLPSRVDRVAAVRTFGAMLLGSLLFVPWAPTFLFQAGHTGTPWAPPASAADLIRVFDDFAGTGAWAVLLAFFYFSLLVLGVFGRRPAADAGEATGQEGVGDDGEPATGGTVGAGDAGAGRSDLEAISHLDEAPAPLTVRERATRLADRAVGFAGFGPGGAGAAARRQQPGEGVTLVLQPNRRALPVFAVLLGTLLLAVAGGMLDNAAFVARYTAAVFPLFVLLVAMGIDVLTRRRLVVGTLSVVCIAGLFTAVANNSQGRTQAAQIAQVLNAEAQPGDLVVYCPDQLGPDVSRLVQVPGLEQLTFPRAIGPQRVDWIDYRQAVAGTNVEAFAQDMIADLQPGHTIWLVWRNGYKPFGGDCGDLASWLSLKQGQGTTVVSADPSYLYEYANLVRYPVG